MACGRGDQGAEYVNLHWGDRGVLHGCYRPLGVLCFEYKM